MANECKWSRLSQVHQIDSVFLIVVFFCSDVFTLSHGCGEVCVLFLFMKFNRLRLLNMLADWNDADFTMGQQELQSLSENCWKSISFAFKLGMRIAKKNVLRMFCWLSINASIPWLDVESLFSIAMFVEQHAAFPFSILGSTGCHHCICSRKSWPWSWGIATATQLQARKIGENSPPGSRSAEELAFF